MGKGKADPSEGREPCAETAFPALAAPLVDRAIEQAAVAAHQPSADGLHELRITMRRLQSLWWAYGPMLDAAESTRQRALFRSLSDTAGRARDYDILIELLQLRHKNAGVFPAEISDARQAALDAGKDLLSNPEVRTLLQQAVAQTSEGLAARQERQALQTFADGRVAESEKRLRKRIKLAARAGKSDLVAFHELRKAAKKVRYLLELFGPLLSQKHTATLKRLRKIQECFGALNDVVASEKLLRENAVLLATLGEPERTLRWFGKERKRRLCAAAALLREGWK